MKLIIACDPPLPPGVFKRLSDNWRPLLAVAQLAGGDWPARALHAFHQLTAKPQTAQDLGLTLLADLRQLFAWSGDDRLCSSAIVDSLRALPDRPWSGANNGHKPIDHAWLARQLRPLGLGPHNRRMGRLCAKGYELSEFAQAFQCLPPPPDSNGQP